MRLGRGKSKHDFVPSLMMSKTYDRENHASVAEKIFFCILYNKDLRKSEFTYFFIYNNFVSTCKRRDLFL